MFSLIVGIMLTSFGIFWGAEGAGVSWPGADAALFAIVGGTALASVLAVVFLKRRPVEVTTEVSA